MFGFFSALESLGNALENVGEKMTENGIIIGPDLDPEPLSPLVVWVGDPDDWDADD